MKKNLTKFGAAAKPSRKRKPRDDIRYLGFVVNPQATTSDALTYALINLEQNPRTWHIVSLVRLGLEPDPRDHVGRYFRTIFFLAIKALRHYRTTSRLEKDDIIIEKNIDRYNKIGSDLRNWDRDDKVKSISPDFPKLRMAIHNSLFSAHGTRRPLSVIWKGKTAPDAIFFWTPRNLQNPQFKKLKDESFQTIEIEGLSPKTELSPESLITLAETLLYFQHGYTWQDLYRKALVNRLRTDMFIELLTLPIMDKQEREQQDQLSQPGFVKSSKVSNTIKVLEIIEDTNMVLLTGPSGSGKTTTLRHLTWLLAIGKLKIKDRDILPVYVPMKWFGIWPKNSDTPLGMQAYIAFWISKTINDNVDISDLTKCDLIKNSKCMYQSRKTMVEDISKQIEGFLDDSMNFQNLIFFFDAYNEIPNTQKQAAIEQLSNFIKRANRCIISARVYDDNNVLSALTRFEIQELDNEQIIEYLNLNFFDQGEKIFFSKISTCPNILSLARNPFYLSLIVKNIQKNKNAILSSNRAKLIQDFVIYSIKRKNQEQLYIEEKVKDDLLYLILPMIAKWSIQIMTSQKNNKFLPFIFSKEYKSIGGSHHDIMYALERAEACGILKSSGLLQDLPEHLGFPEFSHDNFRDFFAALYLQSLEKENLINQLPLIFEYFSWDEPVLLFLELTSDDRTQLVIDFIIPRDVIFASLCVRYAYNIDVNTCLEYAKRIGESEAYQSFEPLLYLDVFDRYPRKLVNKSVPQTIVSRLSIDSLLRLTEQQPHKCLSQTDIWFAIASIVTTDEFTLLESLWHSPSRDFIERFFIFFTILHIRTFTAFKTALKMYRDLQQSQEVNPEILKMVVGPPIWVYLAYEPSLSELTSELLLDEFPTEFKILLSKVRKISDKEAPQVKHLLFCDDKSICIEACKLLARLQKKESIPILLERLDTPFSSKRKDTYSDLTASLPDVILELILLIEPQKGVERLIDAMENARHRFCYSENISLLETLAKIKTKESLKYFVRCFYKTYLYPIGYYCADQIEMWPNRDDVLSEFEPYRRKYCYQGASDNLFYAWLGVAEYLPKALRLFNKIYSSVVLMEKMDIPPVDPLIKKYCKISEEEMDRLEVERNLLLLPMAIHALHSVDKELSSKLFRIIQWATDSLAKDEDEIHFFDKSLYGLAEEDIFYECISQATIQLTKQANMNCTFDVVSQFLESGMFQTIFYLSERKIPFIFGYQFQYKKYCHDKLHSILVSLCKTVPEKYISKLLSVVQGLYVSSMQQMQPDNVRISETLFDIIQCLCERLEDGKALEFVWSLHSTLLAINKPEYLNNSILLFERLKRIKNRRFLPAHNSL